MGRQWGSGVTFTPQTVGNIAYACLPSLHAGATNFLGRAAGWDRLVDLDAFSFFCLRLDYGGVLWRHVSSSLCLSVWNGWLASEKKISGVAAWRGAAGLVFHTAKYI